MHWLHIVRPFGKLTAFFGMLMLLPAAVSLLYGDGLALYYVAAGGGVIVFGGVLIIAAGRLKVDDFRLRHGFVLITLTWTLLPCFAALPLVAVVPNMAFTQAYFEAASGLTASGATVLSGLDMLPPSVNFWRGQMSWMGGMGLIVLAAAILPILGIGGSNVFQTELNDLIKENKITPKIAETAKSLWLVYASLTAVCALAYYVAGMNELDAVVHAFTTIGLGGFSTHDASYAYFQSPVIEAVAVLFMIIAGMNFVTHFTAWSGKNWRVYPASVECRVYLILIAAAVCVVAFHLKMRGVYEDWPEVFRYAAFNTVSIVTTTGYASADFGAWPLFAPVLMLLMANFTACSGSTGGGVKLIRLITAVKQSGTERMKLTHPAAYYDNKVLSPLPQKVIISVLFFLLAYAASAAVLMLFLLATGMDFLTAFSAAVASISNTGPGLGDVGPAHNYGHLTDAQTWACSFAMLLGRLELISFIVVLHPGFWRY